MKTLPLSAYDKNPKSTRAIWGINTAAESDVKVQGELLISIPAVTAGGQADRMMIQQTWLPQELTQVITRPRLLASAEFRNAVAKGLITLIPISEAERLLRQDGAAEELEKLRARNLAVREAGTARTLSDSKAEIHLADGTKVEDDDEDDSTVIIDSNRTQNVAKAAAAGVEEHEPGISVQFKMWVDRVCMSKDVLARNDIRSRSKFSKAELGYLQRNLPRSFTTALALVNANLSK